MEVKGCRSRGALPSDHTARLTSVLKRRKGRKEDCIERASDPKKELGQLMERDRADIPLCREIIYGSEMPDSGKPACCARSWARSSLKLAVPESLLQ